MADVTITGLQAFPVREPVSGRTYTVIKVATGGGPAGYGECAAASAADLESARRAIAGKPPTAYEAIRRDLNAGAPALQGAVNMALLDIAGKLAKAPVYQVLGGPTRNRARALARIEGSSDAELAEGVKSAHAAGFRAVMIPAPRPTARNQGQAFTDAARRRMDAMRAAGPDMDFVLDGGEALTPGDAGSLAAAFERFHLLWFDEPCPASNLRAVGKIAGECVTPVGLGRRLPSPAGFQELLREEAADVMRPDIAVHGISQIRRLSTIAEAYYVAVAPYHDGGPVATAAAIHLAASLPNFFIQQIPLPRAAEDRRKRASLVAQAVESVRDGYLPLPTGPGLGITVNEGALR